MTTWLTYGGFPCGVFFWDRRTIWLTENVKNFPSIFLFRLGSVVHRWILFHPVTFRSWAASGTSLPTSRTNGFWEFWENSKRACATCYPRSTSLQENNLQRNYVMLLTEGWKPYLYHCEARIIWAHCFVVSSLFIFMLSLIN